VWREKEDAGYPGAWEVINTGSANQLARAVQQLGKLMVIYIYIWYLIRLTQKMGI